MAGERFIARSKVMRALADQIRRFARTDSNVLIAGETGSGKNVVARELHLRGKRAKQPFVTIDCPSLSSTLIDSELFGHERGAFTDAIAARAGRFELARSGTVYLDAVNELPLDAQSKLLRIVEEKRVERLGAQTSFAITARVIASTGADIEDDVRAGRFRHDLFHRLRVLPLRVPPLRERTEDVLPLARYFASRAVAADKRPAPAFSRDAAEALRDYAWPGNVRELRHAVEIACQTAADTVKLTDLPDEVLATPTPDDKAPERQPTLDEIERRYVAATLRAVHGNQTEAAARLGISRKALWEKRKRYGMD
ncbi:MAG TPA: sigma-54 dependent transcriptional regulator [Vicinamibacterales bacterium]|nr:sigma-54 dependent transcriptional regulator [Vicinamibacterales bacterium]